MSHHEDYFLRNAHERGLQSRGPAGRDSAKLFDTVRRELRAEVGESGYNAYVQHLQCFGVHDGALIVVADNVVHRDWATRQVLERFEARLAAHGAPEKVRIIARADVPLDWVPVAVPAAVATVPGTVLAAPVGGQHNLGLPPKDDMTFDTFCVGSSNHRAFTVSRMVAKGMGMAFPVVLLHGAPGLGKTHLLHSIANGVLATSPGRKVRLMMAQEFIEEFQAMLHTKRDPAGFKARLRDPDVFLVDDVQRLAGKKATEEEFFDTMLFLRQKAGAQIVLTADHGPDGLAGFDQRLRQQLKAATTCEITAPDLELRRSILAMRMEHYQRLVPDFRLAPAVLDMIAERVMESGRLLDGALAQLLVEASISGEDVTVQIAEEALRGKLGDGGETHRVTVSHVQKVVAAYYGISIHEMMVRTRRHSILRPRQIAKYLCTVHTTASLPDLGRRFALPQDKPWDHTTVMHARDLIPQLMQEQPKLRADVEALTAAVKRKP